MRKDYIKTAFRRLIRNRTISFINIFGLALGLAATFLILLFIFHETSYDNYHNKKDRIYRLIQESKGHDMFTAQCSYPLGDVLKEEYPQVKETARMLNLFSVKIRKNSEYIPESDFYCVENSLFEILNIPVLVGHSEDLTTHPNDIVLTRSMALKYFGETDVVGNQLTIKTSGEDISLNVSGIVEDFPENSSFKPDFLASLDLGIEQLPNMIRNSDNNVRSPEFFKTNWGFGFFMTFILTEEGFEEEKFEKEFRTIEEKYLEQPESINYHLQSLDDIYFKSGHILTQYFESGNISSVYIFSAVGFLILIIASINYILLSTSQAVERAKEIAIRKITGATRKALFNQVLVESVIITLIAFPLAIILIEQFRPFIIRFMDKNFINYEINLKVVLGFGLILFVITYLPGIFTTRYFSRIRPVVVLSRNSLLVSKRYSAKKILISLQFIIFLLLVITSIGIYKQIHFSKHHDLGFNPENVLSVNIANNPAISHSYEAFKKELLEHRDIISVSGSMWVPPTKSRMAVTMKRTEDPGDKINVDGLFVDKDFLETLNIQLVEGKRLSDYANNFNGKVLLNKSALEEVGYENPIGEKTMMGEIVGVIEDFHYHSFKEKIAPMILIGNQQMVREVLVKISGANMQSVRSHIADTWQKFGGMDKPNLTYVNQNFDELYKSENKLATLITIFAGLAILIASMGLLGLTIFTLKKRTKEIAIRKVNGANVKHILALISVEYVKLILYALLVSVPVGYFLLNKWLQDFAYKTTISWWIFAASGILALGITLLTISFKAVKAANRNPVESLRDE